MNTRAMIPIEHPLPEGYEAVTFRVPKVGETFLTTEGAAYELRENPLHQLQQPRLILRKIWVWPDWLKCAVVTRDGHGIYAWDDEPQLLNNAWIVPNPADPIHFSEVPDFIDLGLPELPPSESIWRNPNL